ncbi:hypothetical protein C8F04DRAFT_1177461 [Mycena alexandri]|uniref:Uncharacterized protein n=1 Tax=Mycena alexandri TaxID=1745969 RepID=A0AAD6XAW0_9AGAR|nr:hypothetical protein C8F04DRAFT_1177461 [Mycena alexandri]
MPASALENNNTINDLLDARRGRSADRWVFKTLAHSKPIRPRVRVNFLEALKGALRCLRYNEAYDLVFRGEILEVESCAGHQFTQFAPYRSPSREPTPTEPATPPDGATPARESTPPTEPFQSPIWPSLSPEPSSSGAVQSPTWPSLPQPDSQADSLFSPTVSVSSPRGGLFDTGDTHPGSREGSPLTPVPSDRGSSPSPSSGTIDLLEIEHIRRVHPPSPTLTELFQEPKSASISPGKKLITYSRRDRERHGRNDLGETTSAPAVLQVTSAVASTSTSAATVLTAPERRLPLRYRQLDHWPASEGLRRSARLGQQRVSQTAGYSSQPFLRLHQIITIRMSDLRPLVDNNLVIGAIAGNPVGDPAGEPLSDWPLLVARGTRDLQRVHFKADFTHLPKTPICRSVSFPHRVVNSDLNRELISPVVLSDCFRALAAYQNHLLKQMAPRVHAYSRFQLDTLQDCFAIFPAFPGSAFSTAQFTFGNSHLYSRRNVRDILHGFRVITVLGNFTICYCILPDDNIAIHCFPGSTVLIAGSVKHYFFTKVEAKETRFLFEQFFDACVQRWIDRGFRSDTDYEENATDAEIVEVETKLANRIPFAMKLFSRLHEIHV